MDAPLVGAWFRQALRPDGWSPPSPWDAVSGDYRAADGWIRLHTNAPRHREAALRVLGVEADLTSDGVGVDAGYPQPTDPDGSGPKDGLYTKPALADYPQYLKVACGAAACTTLQYKTATRKHIEGLGYDIVANFGDQYSDLKGGAADRDFKLPNPSYYLPRRPRRGPSVSVRAALRGAEQHEH